MKRYFVAHEDWVLAVAGIVLFALVIGFLVWSITRISQPIAAALNAGGADAGKIQFNVDAFKKTNLRGLNPSQ